MPHSHPRTQRYDMRHAPPQPVTVRYRTYWLMLAAILLAILCLLLLIAVAHVTRRPW